MSTTDERCGLCGTESMFLVASPWGQVHKHCLSAKSRAARRGASLAVPSPEARDEALRQEERAAVAAYLRHRAEVYQGSHGGLVCADEADRIERAEHLRPKEGT